MFAYCGNNPVSRKDDSGESWLLIGLAVVAAATIALSNRSQNENNRREIDENLKDSYSLEECEFIVNDIINQYKGYENPYLNHIDVNEESIKIIDSYYVTNVYDRQYICEVIVRTVDTQRTSSSLSAEWFVHNIAYELDMFKDSSKDVDLNYEKDSRWYVNLSTSISQFFGYE